MNKKGLLLGILLGVGLLLIVVISVVLSIVLGSGTYIFAQKFAFKSISRPILGMTSYNVD